MNQVAHKSDPHQLGNDVAAPAHLPFLVIRNHLIAVFELVLHILGKLGGLQALRNKVGKGIDLERDRDRTPLVFGERRTEAQFLLEHPLVFTSRILVTATL